MVTVLSVGAGNEQVFSIKEAKDRGFFVVAIDGNCDAVGLAYADIQYVIDLKDEIAIIEIAKKHQIDFILPSPIGRFLTTIGAVNESLSLTGITKSVAKMFVDKSKFREKMCIASLYTPKQTVISCTTRNSETISEAIEDTGYPCILKPNNGSGSRGVIVVQNKKDMEKAMYLHLERVFSNEDTLVESFVNGQELGIDAVILDNQCRVLSIRKKLMTTLPYRQEIGYIMDSHIDCMYRERVELSLQKLVNTIGIEASLLHADIIINDSDLYIVEASCRPAGLTLMEQFLPLTIGFSPVTKFIDILEGGTPSMKIKKNDNNSFGIFFFDLPNGIVRSIPSYMIVDRLVLFECNIYVGDYLSQVREGKDIIARGSFIVKGNSEKEILQMRDKVLNAFNIEEVSL